MQQSSSAVAIPMACDVMQLIAWKMIRLIFSKQYYYINLKKKKSKILYHYVDQVTKLIIS